MFTLVVDGGISNRLVHDGVSFSVLEDITFSFFGATYYCYRYHFYLFGYNDIFFSFERKKSNLLERHASRESRYIHFVYHRIKCYPTQETFSDSSFLFLTCRDSATDSHTKPSRVQCMHIWYHNSNKHTIVLISHDHVTKHILFYTLTLAHTPQHRDSPC